MRIACSSPTCTRALNGVPPDITERARQALLHAFGWAIEQHDDDDRPTAYCARCRD